jgi:KaiC/GvpD/RAD55 family RecA-like ATPase
VGSFGVLGGAPGSGKTTLLCQIALYRLEAGDHVVLLAADESPDGLLIRLGQLLGLDREALEQGEPEARRALATALRTYSPRLELLDVADGWTIEDAADSLMITAGESPKFLGVDSIQTARALGTDTADGPRARADAVVHALKGAARHGIFVLATSELARGAYRSNDPAQRSNSLASFKESGSVEYGVDFALVLRSVSGEADLVDVEVAKNRLGSKPEFRLRLDRTRALFREEGAVQVDPGAEREARLLRERAALREAVLTAVRKPPALAGREALCERVPRRRLEVARMLRVLIEEGAVVQRAGAWRVAADLPSDEG